MKYNNNKITALLLAVSVLTLAGCAQGPYETREESVSGFNRVSIETYGEVLISQGSEESLSIEAPRDYLRYITSEVTDGTLNIKTRRGFVGSPVQRVTYTLTVKDLNEVSFSGAGSIKVFSLKTNDFKVNLTGAGSIEMDDLKADTLVVNLTSAGAVVIAGNVETQDINLSGVGSYEGGDLRSDEAIIQLTGAGSAVVWAENKLDVNISGVGSVAYFGDPEVTQNISGLGSVNSKGKH
ncbi:MAG: DUF2807 domain-containing protein [Anaerolineaceae bacterium]|nr:DUF2807 domain-containing protein [Anaerolineaceae bacterium]